MLKLYVHIIRLYDGFDGKQVGNVLKCDCIYAFLVSDRNGTFDFTGRSCHVMGKFYAGQISSFFLSWCYAKCKSARAVVKLVSVDISYKRVSNDFE